MHRDILISGVLLIALFVALFIFVPGFENTRVYAIFARGLYRLEAVLNTQPSPDVILPVIFDKQDHALSCEVAVLKMALAYRGVVVEEAELVAKVGFDKTKKQYRGGLLVWGDPHKGFVGDINGKMPSTGYGVYWEPIAKAANEYRTASAFSGWSVQDLSRELDRGNPVLIWGHLGSGKPFYWNTLTGTTVKAVYYEHAFLVHGRKGSMDNPEGFFVVDPIYGPLYWTTAELVKHWGSLDNSGVVVY